ncbi:MAG: AsmA-like C-terminal region-containing protein [Balneolaceae bacterium]
MKLFLKILAGIAIFLVVLIIGLNLYFTDDRLKSMILPQIQETVGTDIQVGSMSITFFRTFPQFGLEMEQFTLPDPNGDNVVSLNQMIVGVHLFPLLRDEISISELILNEPTLTYHVYEDGTTNIDFLMNLAEEDAEPTEEEGYAIAIPSFTLESAEVDYRDDNDTTLVQLRDLNATIALQFDDLIESTVDADFGSISASMGGENYVDNLSISLNQTSTVDLENEELTLTEGVLSIRGLGLNISGQVSDWSSDAPMLDLQFSSSSENFGELLRLAPPEFDEQLEGLETRGSLVLEGSVNGSITEDSLPRFDLLVNVNEGYVQNPDLPDAIEDIILEMNVNNDLATIEQFSARADENTISASGTVERPLEEDAVFSIEFDGDVDLATISRFYPIEEFGVNQLSGLLAAEARANGRIDLPEDATFSGSFVLTDGALQYTDVPQPIEQINARIEANQDRVTIEESGFVAESNTFTMSGSVDNPLDENSRAVDLTSTLSFDLATIKDFYPIDEDTLELRGQFDANVTLRGTVDPDNLEELLQQSTFNLRDGFIAHQDLGRPLEDIVMEAEATSTQLNISQARFRTGENNLAMTGSVSNYLSDDPTFDLSLDGNANFGDIATYYSLEPWIQELTGDAQMRLSASGPAGDPMQIALNGSLEVENVSAVGDSLPQPISDLRGQLSVTPDEMSLEDFYMKFGSTDIGLDGTLNNYLGFMEEHENTSTMPSISGTYRSQLLNMDEMIDWDEETDPNEPVPIELPNITSSVTAQIDSLVIFGLSITQIAGTGRTTPDQIVMEDASAEMFDGTATGNMEWNVPQPDRTNMTFNGNLEGLRAEVFFEETGFLGEDSRFHEYVTGEFSTEISYFTEFDETITPDMTTTDADGSFGMTRASLEGHPIQTRVAQLLQADELNKVNLDEWTAMFTIRDAVLTFEDFNLTSDNIGVELEGTQHMITDEIDFKATLMLPEQFKGAIASVISNRAADALQAEDGRMAVPVLITGTSQDPQVRPDTSVINQIIEDAIKEGAGNVIRRLFNGN